MNPKEQGVNAGNIFHGDGVSEAARLMYKESAPLFAEAISSRLEKGEYSLADLGSHMGDFLKDLIALLPEYTFKTIAIDVNADDLEKNKADQKIVSNLTKIEVPDRSVDIVICRYTLAWNNLETQREILREIKRISKGLVVIQHQGANSLNPEVLQKASKELFSGVIPQLKRDAFFFSTAEQLEVFMKELEITFERIQDKTVNGLSGLFIDKYGLSDTEADEVKRILKDSDYLTLSSWVLKL